MQLAHGFRIGLQTSLSVSIISQASRYKSRDHKARRCRSRAILPAMLNYRCCLDVEQRKKVKKMKIGQIHGCHPTSPPNHLPAVAGLGDRCCLEGTFSPRTGQPNLRLTQLRACSYIIGVNQHSHQSREMPEQSPVQFGLPGKYLELIAQHAFDEGLCNLFRLKQFCLLG